MSSRYAIIENNVVKNIVICTDEEAKVNKWIFTETASIGDRYENGEFIKEDGIFKDWETVRLLRNQLLNSSDWVVISSLEKNTPISNDWKEYRQQLRDITSTFSSPDEVVFPTLPS